LDIFDRLLQGRQDRSLRGLPGAPIGHFVGELKHFALVPQIQLLLVLLEPPVALCLVLNLPVRPDKSAVS